MAKNQQKTEAPVDEAETEAPAKEVVAKRQRSTTMDHAAMGLDPSVYGGEEKK